jgi:AcrR family transcriptional regulator
MKEELVRAALSAARKRGTDVAEVPLPAIAAEAGISRSTLLRRLGGDRSALDEAVRAAGVDPGGRPPVRERAIAAAARLVGERGIAEVTLEAIADAAQCSLPSLHTAFGGRDGLILALVERHSPLGDFERLAEAPPADLEGTVRGIHVAIMDAMSREPRVFPIIFAELFGRPHGPVSEFSRVAFPRIFGALTRLLQPHIEAGRLRPVPLPVLIQQLMAPAAIHARLAAE